MDVEKASFLVFSTSSHLRSPLSSPTFVLPISIADALMEINRLYSINRELSFTVRESLKTLPFLLLLRPSGGRWESKLSRTHLASFFFFAFRPPSVSL